VKELDHEDGSNLRTGIFRPAAGGEHDSKPDSALIEFAQGHDLEVPGEWASKMTATLERRWSGRGLSVVRDLAAEGQIQVVLRTRRTA